MTDDCPALSSASEQRPAWRQLPGRAFASLALAGVAVSLMATTSRAEPPPPPDRTLHVTSQAVAGFAIPRWTVRAAVEAPVDRLWSVIDNCARYKDTMPRISRSREVSRQAGRMVCATTVDMPLPLSDLDDESEFLTSVSASRRSSVFRLLQGDWRKKEGSWLLEPIAGHPGWTQVTYVLHAVPDSAVPDALVRRGQAAAFADLFQNLARFARQP